MHQSENTLILTYDDLREEVKSRIEIDPEAATKISMYSFKVLPDMINKSSNIIYIDKLNFIHIFKVKNITLFKFFNPIVYQ